MAFSMWTFIANTMHEACRRQTVKDIAHKAGCEPEDVAQDALLKAVIKARRGGGGIHAVSGRDLKRYANTMARTSAIDAHRRHRARTSLIGEDGNRYGGEMLLLDESWVAMIDSQPNPEQRLLARDREREALARRARDFSPLAHAMSGACYAEQARAQGVAPSTISRRAKRAFDQIRYERVQPLLPFCVEREEVQ